MSEAEIIEKLEESGDFKVLRRLDFLAVPHAREVEADLIYSAGLALDCETNGLDCDRHSIIELGARVFWYYADGRIVALGDALHWLEDPGSPLPENIQRLTGLRDEGLAGRAIDDGAVARLVGSVDVIVSHHADFDRKFFERRFPRLKSLAWACSLREIAWPDHKFHGRGLGSLLMRCGWFSPTAHRAGADVDAMIALLMHRFDDTGETALSELLATAKRATWRLTAAGANYDVKNDLKDRGYRWNLKVCAWEREVEECDLVAEQAWLMACVYAPRFHPSAKTPRVEKITWRERHA